MAQATMRGPLAAASSSTSVPYGAPSPSAWGTACSPSSSFSWSHCDFSRRAEAGAMASCARPLVLANSVRSGRNCRRVDALVVRSGFLGCWEGKSWPSLCCSLLPQRHQQRKRQGLLPVRAAAGPSDGVRWWEKEAGPNVHDIHSTQEFIDALSKAGDKLVVVEFFATWCGSCRALFPKFCKLAAEHENVDFLKVNFDENKPMCKSLNIKVLPFFHFYRGADGRLDAFSCSLSKLQKLKDAIATHNTDRCSIGPPLGVGDIDLTAPVSTSDQPAAAGTSR